MTPNFDKAHQHLYDTMINGFSTLHKKIDDHMLLTDEKMERKIEAHFKDVHIPENKEIRTYVKTIAASLVLILILHIVGVLPAALDLIKGIF